MGYARLRRALKATGLAAGLHLGLAATAGAADLCAEGVIVIREEAERRVVTFPGFHPFQLSTTLDCDPGQSCAYDISVLSSGVFNVQFADVEIADICETSRFDESYFALRGPGQETPNSPGQYEAGAVIAIGSLLGYVHLVRWDSHYAPERISWSSPLLLAQDGPVIESRYAEATVAYSFYHIVFSSER